MNVITPSEIKKKIKERTKFIIYFTENTFSFFNMVQRIFFRNKIGWVASGMDILDLDLRLYCIVLYFDGKDLSFDDSETLSYEPFDAEDIYEEYIFSLFDKKKKLLI